MSYWDIRVEFRPVSTWPGQRTASRKASPFKAKWGDTLATLKTELRQLGAKDVVIEIEMDESMIRLDGYPKADARAKSPGVVLSLASKYGPLRYPCDRFTKWEDNLRAIALALEALRKVDRYGVTKRGEQYKGWKALPSEGTITMDIEVAAAFMEAAADAGGLMTLASAIIADPGASQRAYRAAVKVLHPDAGGNNRDFQTLMEAKRALDAHHGNAA